MNEYTTRLVDQLIAGLFAELPALLIVGPRATGKTTTASRYARSIVHLDREAEAAVFRADPDAALRDLPEPILLDEWQVVPEVLGAVKRAVDTGWRPGRFLVTGSVRGKFDGARWPGTGRLTPVPMSGMTVREQLGALAPPPFIDRVAAGSEIRPAADSPDLRGYVEVLLRGGFPEAALEMSVPARQQWLEGYIEHTLTRDADQVSEGRDPARLRQYLEANAVNTAGVVDHKTLYDAARIDRKTALAYDALLGSLLVVEMLPAWATNRLKRLVLTPKRHVTDAALVAALLRLDVAGIMRNGDLLGRLLDSFVVSQLRAELPVAGSQPRLYHLRQEQGRLEVDLIAELGGGRIIAMEVKATAAPTARDARHLVTLRERLGEDFIAGIVFHTGPRTFRMSDRISAVPISALWAG